MITFAKLNASQQSLIFAWLAESHVQEFWDNSQAHKDDIINFIEGRKTPSNYANGEYNYWIGAIDSVPYCMMMSIKELPNQPREDIKNQFLSTTGSTYSLDFMIGNKAYYGKGLAAKTINAFINFLKNRIDSSVDTFFIDPAINNPKAKHVYEKAGFRHISDFAMGGNGVFAGQQTHFLVKKLA